MWSPNDYYELKGFNQSFTDDMIAHNFTYGEEIEVSDDNEDWHDAIFVGYVDGAKYKYNVVQGGAKEEYNINEEFYTSLWKYARKIRKPKYDITITKNGEPFSGKLSVESARSLGIVE